MRMVVALSFLHLERTTCKIAMINSHVLYVNVASLPVVMVLHYSSKLLRKEDP